MTVEVKIAVLVIVAAALALATRRSLTSLYSHGVYRLAGAVAAIALVLLNLEGWFTDPLAAHQVASWCLLLLSAVTPVYGYVSLRKGRPSASRGDPTLMDVERTTELVEAGAYRYVRHPIYSSFLFAAFGIFLKDVSWQGGVLTATVLLCAFLAAKTEERENIAYFGDEYRSYMKRTKMFIPRLL
jgi:protein-S-isoprenylcysteine O-methyltransferase Ste14